MKSRLTRSGARTWLRVGLGGEALLGPGGATDALLSHEPGHLVPPDVDVPTSGRLPELAAAVDGVVLLPQGPQLRSGGGVPHGPGRRRPGLGVVVGGGGDLQFGADRLDPPSTPIGLLVPMGVDEGDYFFPRRSSSAPKKVAAACRMSLERRSSKFSLRSRFSSACSSVVRPRPLAGVDLGLLHPGPEGLVADTQLAGHPRDHRLVAGILCAGAPGPSARPAPSAQADTALLWALLFHDSILASKVWSLRGSQAGSNVLLPPLPGCSAWRLHDDDHVPTVHGGATCTPSIVRIVSHSTVSETVRQLFAGFGSASLPFSSRAQTVSVVVPANPGEAVTVKAPLTA